jgi:hypothetical protein
MKNSPSALSMPILILALLVLFAGCGGLSANPSPNPAPTSAAHGTFVFVNGFESSLSPTDGFRLNPDGTLTSLPGSPFPITGFLAVSNGFLVVASPNVIDTYKVDPATGVPSRVGSAAIGSPGAMAADAKGVYVVGFAFPDSLIYGFSVSDSGALSQLPGSPYVFGSICELCLRPNSLALNSNFLAMGTEGFRASGDISVYVRNADGKLVPGGATGFDEQDHVALQRPGGNVAFSSHSGLIGLNSYLLDASGRPSAVMSFGSDISFVDENFDATGKFLIGLDNTGVVHAFTIDPATADFSQIAASERVGNGADLVALDPSGHFVIVAQSSTQALPAPPDQITVFTFDPASGAMKKPRSYPVSKSPGRIAIVAE